MNEFGGLSHPKTPRKNKRLFAKVGIIIWNIKHMYETKNNIMVCSKMVPRKITIREWLFGVHFFYKGNSTPIGLDENGQESMLDAPWAIPKHKHVYFTMDSAQNFLCLNFVTISFLSKWLNGHHLGWTNYSIVNHTQISYNPLYHQNNLLMANPVSKISPLVKHWSTT